MTRLIKSIFRFENVGELVMKVSCSWWKFVYNLCFENPLRLCYNHYNLKMYCARWTKEDEEKKTHESEYQIPSNLLGFLETIWRLMSVLKAHRQTTTKRQKVQWFWRISGCGKNWNSKQGGEGAVPGGWRTLRSLECGVIWEVCRFVCLHFEEKGFDWDWKVIEG